MCVDEAPPPVCRDSVEADTLELIVEPRPVHSAGMLVRRVLPSLRRGMVGPFVSFQHLGPTRFLPGEGADVLPHPHIHLATLTYLFDGELEHRDSLGSYRSLSPGALHWMKSGRGIVHSERTAMPVRQAGQRLHGLQLWVALPVDAEETEPEFEHHPAASLPRVELEGARLRVLAGSAYGRSSPVKTCSPLFLVEARLDAGALLELPPGYPERAVYVVSGSIACGLEFIPEPKLLVLRPGASATLRATSDARVVLLGGEPLDGPRHISWNFVSSSAKRIERAKRDWAERRFPLVPGDEEEFLPLPAR